MELFSPENPRHEPPFWFPQPETWFSVEWVEHKKTRIQVGAVTKRIFCSTGENCLLYVRAEKETPRPHDRNATSWINEDGYTEESSIHFCFSPPFSFGD